MYIYVIDVVIPNWVIIAALGLWFAYVATVASMMIAILKLVGPGEREGRDSNPQHAA